MCLQNVCNVFIIQRVNGDNTMRPQPREIKVCKSIYLPPRLWDFVQEVGAGEYAAGIRYLLEIAYKQERAQAVCQHTGADSTGVES